MNGLKIIEGGVSVDDRGLISYVNGFHFEDVRRFYIVQNHNSPFIRAWHAHKNEAKYIYVISGSALVGAVEIDDWDAPSKDLIVHQYILSEKKPSVLFIPKGYANGFMSLTNDLKVIFFSTSSLAESVEDDYRYDSHYWDIWNIVER